MTHFGHTQVLEEKRENLTLGERQGENSRWPSDGYKQVSQLQREDETNQKDYKPQTMCQKAIRAQQGNEHRAGTEQWRETTADH